MEAEFHCFVSRRDVVRAAEGGKEVVERDFVGQIDDCETQAPLVVVPVQEIIVTDAGVEEMARRNALRPVIVILRSRRWDLEQLRSESGGIAECKRGACRARSGGLAVAGQSGLELLIGGEG